MVAFQILAEKLRILRVEENSPKPNFCVETNDASSAKKIIVMDYHLFPKTVPVNLAKKADETLNMKIFPLFQSVINHSQPAFFPSPINLYLYLNNWG